MAAAAIDNAIWDLRARLLDLPLVKLFGMVRNEIPVYEAVALPLTTIEGAFPWSRR